MGEICVLVQLLTIPYLKKNQIAISYPNRTKINVNGICPFTKCQS